MTPTKGTIGTCIKCGRVGKMCARGLCNTCYDKDIRSRKIKPCQKCGEVRPHHSQGLCYRCASDRDYYKDHEESKRKIREQYNKNRDRENAKDRARNKTQKRKAWQQAYNQKRDRDKIRAYHKAYYQSNKDKHTHWSERRIARLAGLPYDLTEKQWKEILERHHYQCAYCGISNVPLEREHKIPVSRGGGYTASNIVPACRPCNQRKHTMTDEEFIAFLKKYPRK